MYFALENLDFYDFVNLYKLLEPECENVDETGNLQVQTNIDR